MDILSFPLPHNRNVPVSQHHVQRRH